MKVLGIGETIIDKVYLSDKLSKPSLDNLKPAHHVGGPVPAALAVLSKLDIDTTLVTSIGRDENAQIIKKTLKKMKIKLLHKLQKNSKTNIILVDKHTGERKKIRGATVHPDIKNLDRKFIRQFSVIIIDRHERTAFYEIMNKKRKETKVIIDPSVEVSEFTQDMIRLADFPILPIESLSKIGVNNLNASLKKVFSLTNKNIIITAGDKGSFIYNGKVIELIPAFNVNAIDVTGAGDVYRGAFAYGIIKNWDIKKCAAFANFTAALQCTKLGNLGAIPNKIEMQVFELINKRSKTTVPIIDNIFKSFITV